MYKKQKIIQSASATTVYALENPSGGKRLQVSSVVAIGTDAACKFSMAKIKVQPLLALALTAIATSIRLTTDAVNSVVIDGHTVADGDLIVLPGTNGAPIVRALSIVASGGADKKYLTATITAAGAAVKVGTRLNLVRLTGGDIDQIDIVTGAAQQIIDKPIFTGEVARPVLLAATAAINKTETVSFALESICEG